MRILYIDIDTLRPDHMSCYGYSRETTPNMDKICAEGVRFNQYYCADAPCLPSRASLLSGMFGIRHGAVGHGNTAADRRPTGLGRSFQDVSDTDNFVNIFRKAGMHTASISSFPERHSSYWFNAGFNETYNVGKGGMESGEEVLPIALDWFERKGKEDNWFMHLHLWDPHTPYRAPADFGNPFENQPLNNWITQEVFDEHLQHIGPHSANEISMFGDWENPEYPRQPGKIRNLDELKNLYDGYDCGILYADYLIGKVVERLKALNIYEDTAIIISSDHGENMGELGIYAEHATADNITCRVPLIIKWKGWSVGGVVDGLHCNVDLAPTMADLLGIEKSKHWDGISFAEAVSHGKECGRESVVLSQMAHVCQRSARFDDWIYIRTYHCGYHLFDDEMLFNLTDDPYQQHDLKEQHPELCQRGAKIILDWHDQMLAKSAITGYPAGGTSDPMWTVLREGGPYHTIGALDFYLKRLRSTGREQGADRLEAKYKKH